MSSSNVVSNSLLECNGALDDMLKIDKGDWMLFDSKSSSSSKSCEYSVSSNVSFGEYGISKHLIGISWNRKIKV